MKKFILLISMFCLSNQFSINASEICGLSNQDDGKGKTEAEYVQSEQEYKIDHDLNLLDKPKCDFQILNEKYPRETEALVDVLQESQSLAPDVAKLIIEYCETCNYKPDQTIVNDFEKTYRAIQLKNGDIVTYLDKIKIWSLDSNGFFKCIQVLDEHTNFISTVIQLDNGDLASASADKTIKIFRQTINKWKCIKTWQAHKDAIWSLVEQDNGNLASSSADGSIKIWHLDHDNLLCSTFKEFSTCPLIISLNNGDLASCKYDPYITIRHKNIDGSWNIKILGGEKRYMIKSVIKLRNNNLASCSTDKKINIWSQNSDNEWECVETLKSLYDIDSIIELTNGDLVSYSLDLKNNKTIIQIWRQDLNYSFNCIQTIVEEEGIYSSMFELNNGYLGCCLGNKIKTYKIPFGNLFKTAPLPFLITSFQAHIKIDIQPDSNVSISTLNQQPKGKSKRSIILAALASVFKCCRTKGYL